VRIRRSVAGQSVDESSSRRCSGDAPDTCTFEEGLLTQRITDAVYESSERGEAVRLD
jgi:predicted dehydrogenase